MRLNVTTEAIQLYKVKVDIKTNLRELWDIWELNRRKNKDEHLYASFDISKIDKPYSFIKVIWATAKFAQENQVPNRFRFIGSFASFTDSYGADFKSRIIKEKELGTREDDFYDIEMRFSKTFLIDNDGLIISRIQE